MSRKPWSPLRLTLVSFLGTFLSIVPRIAVAANDRVTVGTNGAVSDAILFIAQAKGYFQEQELTVELVPFDSGPRMVAPLGAGQLDAGAATPSAGLYNAAARGIDIKIVADKASSPPGYGYVQILVRKALVDSSKVRTFADFKGLKVAEGAEGSALGSLLNETLIKAGLTYRDVEHVYMGYAQQVAALANGAIDASVMPEPLATQAIASGAAVRLSGDSIYPNQQAGVLLYSGDFIKKRAAVAERFMVAYIKAARFYNSGLKDGHLAGANAEEIITILVENTSLKDREPAGCSLTVCKRTSYSSVIRAIWKKPLLLSRFSTGPLSKKRC
jgi:NitT/TauT family transport system substrate-binding protein